MRVCILLVAYLLRPRPCEHATAHCVGCGRGRGLDLGLGLARGRTADNRHSGHGARRSAVVTAGLENLNGFSDGIPNGRVLNGLVVLAVAVIELA